ncbi:hypothetical protein FRUB_06359 [Fimbriiglobus ruber]|uniref:Uncharacterized protein n=1 Tax=Fimbriiglobus ruber TaxID=1908690 RepID=A0A225DGP7_9BACT|nr:hypothetical protein FRUB_06359 [Fimbriiglobus ruber]
MSVTHVHVARIMAPSIRTSSHKKYQRLFTNALRDKLLLLTISTLFLHNHSNAPSAGITALGAGLRPGRSSRPQVSNATLAQAAVSEGGQRRETCGREERPGRRPAPSAGAGGDCDRMVMPSTSAAS